jgi:YhcH/YjgK/YiaL family protein
MSVILLRLQSGEIALFYLLKNSMTDCRPVMRRSFDEGRTWSEPTVCITDEVAYYVLNNDRVIQLRDGRLLFAVSKHTLPNGAFDHTAVVLTYTSDDNGRTWRRGRSELRGVGPDGRRCAAQEPGVVELRDGSVLLWFRSDAGYQLASRSDDRGETWSAPQPSRLCSPLSPASIKRLPTGDLLAVWNDHESKPEMRTHHADTHKWAHGWRSPLAAALSRDEGRTWSGVKMIEDDPEGWFCYTAIDALDDGTALLAYCAYGQLAHSRIVKVPVAWFYEAGCADGPAMVRGSLADSAKYERLHPRFAKAFEFLRTHELDKLPLGRNEIDGDDVYANVMDVTLGTWDANAKLEVHRQYIDIHVPISGDEVDGFIRDEDGVRAAASRFDVEKDYALFRNPKMEKVTVKKGEFAAFFPPFGAHAPNQTDGSPRRHRKLVVKVRR